ncbi:hypothetical protein Dtox_1834 [Desulfofarcimen acetoxidans DSM 771]|uniref:Uncharacterized protein n=1 Tax=Desulfofarcimen acetoxidans (strain ATCC 49208 / DSM 771 / KCTC 5769 / VKM B-1644 / 5575) TaxID=485916 RepID=C8VXM6_DESAS|nr:DUF6577 family protein [Desulfofarcimen acetoxidans]ACV62682.1 hypothetical protein Dtox_1834 [Desulfofarcimen acetoxidans DSM 771]
MKKDRMRLDEIRNRFGNQDSFTAQQLYSFYSEQEADLNVGTFRWRVHHLKELGIIRNLKRGIYVFESNKNFEPIVSRTLTKLYNLIRRQYPYTDISIWDTVWLHNFMIHQPAYSLIVVEVEKEAINAVFEMLREKMRNVYIYSKKNNDIDYMISSNSIIIKPYLKESPVSKNKKIVVPKIEKILVDLYFEESLFITYHGQEIYNIFENIFSKYTINITTLYRYARYRTIKENLRWFLLNQVQIDKKYL